MTSNAVVIQVRQGIVESVHAVKGTRIIVLDHDIEQNDEDQAKQYTDTLGAVNDAIKAQDLVEVYDA